MSEKTNYSRLLPWGIAVTITLAIGLLSGSMHWQWLQLPWSLAEFVSRQVSIAHFQSINPDVGTYWPQRWHALAGIIILFVVGPSLWVWSEIRNQEKENTLKKGFAWYVGAVIVLFGLFTGVLGSTVEGIVQQNTEESKAISANKDGLRTELNKMAFDAIELYYLPHEMGGGDGSFQRISMADTVRPIRLGDLESYGSHNSSNEYILQPVKSDSSITISGIGHKKAGDPNFENANGEQGKLQVQVTITPSKEDVFSINTVND